MRRVSFVRDHRGVISISYQLLRGQKYLHPKFHLDIKKEEEFRLKRG